MAGGFEGGKKSRERKGEEAIFFCQNKMIDGRRRGEMKNLRNIKKVDVSTIWSLT